MVYVALVFLLDSKALRHTDLSENYGHPPSYLCTLDKLNNLVEPN